MPMIQAAPVNDRESRLELFAKLLGKSAFDYEQSVYAAARLFSQESEQEGVKLYNGGFWDVEQADIVGTPHVWLVLKTEHRYRFVGQGNFADEIVDARMFSMAMNLIATSNLSIEYFEQYSQKARSPRYADELPELEQRTEYLGDMHHALKGHFLDSLAHEPERIALLLRLID